MVLFVTDVNGNVSSCTATVTVNDVTAPVALCQNTTINLASTGSVTVAASTIDAGSRDACGIASTVLSPNTFACADLGANTVVLTVTDVNGNVSTCSATVTVTNDPLVLTLGSPVFACGYNVSCNGNTDGSVQSTVSGGCEPYSYAWSNGSNRANPSGLGAGSYTLTVTDGAGTQTTASITLTQPAQLAVSGVSANTYVGGFNIRCAGESNGQFTVSFGGGADCLDATVSISGPVSGSQSASGSATFTGLSAGTYGITVVDANGCSASSSITLTEPAPVLSDAGSNVSVFYGTINGNCVTLNGTQTGGVGPYTVSWNVGSSTGALVASTSMVQVCPTVTTTYCYTVTDANGCTYTDCMTVCVTDIRCGNSLDKVQVCHVPPGNPSRLHTICINPADVANHVPGHPGDYLGACGTTVPPCGIARTGEYVASSASASDGMEDGIELTVFPNPFQDATVLRFKLGNTEKATVRVYDLNGTLVADLFEGEAENGMVYELDFRPENLANGIYLAKVVTTSGKGQVIKLVLNR